jgi:hypothetical protein
MFVEDFSFAGRRTTNRHTAVWRRCFRSWHYCRIEKHMALRQQKQDSYETAVSVLLFVKHSISHTEEVFLITFNFSKWFNYLKKAKYLLSAT